jgi:hypothetical protein
MTEYQPYPKMLYHPKTGKGIIVANEAEHERLLEEWTAPDGDLTETPALIEPAKRGPGRPRK